MDVFCQDGGAQPPAGLLFDYPPAWNRALCRFIDAERRRFRGRSIRMELDLNGRLQAAVTTGFPLRVCTAPAATRVRVQQGLDVSAVDGSASHQSAVTQGTLFPVY